MMAAISPPSASPAIVLAGFDASARQRLEGMLPAGRVLHACPSAEETQEALTASEVAVLCIGGTLSGTAAHEILVSLYEQQPETQTVAIVVAAGPDITVFQDMVEDGSLYYLSRESLPLEDLAVLLDSAYGRFEAGDTLFETGSATSPEDRMLAFVRAIATETDVEPACSLTARAIRQLLDADSALVYLYDPDYGALWDGKSEDRESAAAGLVSFVARTSTAIRLDHAGDDPRFDREADTSGGDGSERFLAVPVRRPDGSVVAVLGGLRKPSRDGFDNEDEERIEALATQVAPTYSALARQVMGEGQPDEASVFRREALRQYAAGSSKGDILRISPRWVNSSYRLLLASLTAALLFSLIGRVHEYANGPAVVRLEGRTDVTASAAGTVTSVDVVPGNTVTEGQVLVRLYDAQEAGELGSLQKEFELQLADRLRDPADPGPASALIGLRARKELLQARLEERTIRAPFSGIVRDVRAQPGQPLAPGNVILSLEREVGTLSLVALVPGEFRPLVAPGLPLRLELEGYKYAYLNLVVESVDEEVVGPTEARRALGAEIADAVPVDGPVIFVRGRITASTFESNGRSYTLHDGMHGVAEIRVRSEPILVALVPALKVFYENDNG